MSEFKVGDKVRGVVSGRTYTIIGIDESDANRTHLWTKREGDDWRTSLTDEQVEKLPDFFEKGKRYRDRHSGASRRIFDCRDVQEGYGGGMAAWGPTHGADGTTYWSSRSIFRGWEEV